MDQGKEIDFITIEMQRFTEVEGPSSLAMLNYEILEGLANVNTCQVFSKF